MLELNRAYTERTYTRGFCFSDDLTIFFEVV